MRKTRAAAVNEPGSSRLLAKAKAGEASHKSSAPDGLPGSRALHRLYRRVGGELPGLLALSLADVASSRLTAGREEDFVQYRQFIVRLWRHYRRQAGVGGPPRLLDGRDICRLLGVRPGPLVGRLLEELAVAQLEGRVRDRAQAEALVRRLAGEICSSLPGR